MKKLCTVLLIAVILTACGGNDGTPVGKIPENIFMSHKGHPRYTFIEGGAFYEDPDGIRRALMFVDFNSLNSVPVCPKPNCTHKDENCSALGMTSAGGLPIFHNDKLFYLTEEIKAGAEGLALFTRIMTADTDGSNRRQIYEIKGIKFLWYSYVIADDFLYFLGRTYDFVQTAPGHTIYGGGSRKLFLFSFCLKTHKLNELALLCEGFEAVGGILGVFNDEIYLSVQYNEEDFGNDFTAAYNALIYEEKVYSFVTGKVTDKVTGKITDSSLQYAGTVTQEYFIYTADPYTENERVFARSRSGEETLLDDIGLMSGAFGTIFGDKFYNLITGKGWDFTKNELFAINEEFVFNGLIEDGDPEFFYQLVTMHGGDFIMRRSKGSPHSAPYEFIRVSKTKLIKETTS
jgi:hypothetical protein